MSSYFIRDKQKNEAERLNVIIKVSTNKRKKIDVFDLNDCYICTIGAINHRDIFELQDDGVEWPEILLIRDRYLNRHKYNCTDTIFYSCNLLWNF